MRKVIVSVLLIAVVLVFSCDTHETTFEESISSLFLLTTNTTPVDGGTTVPSTGEFSEGEKIQIEAKPTEGFVFDRWGGDLTGNSNPDTLEFDSDKSVTAYFSPKDYKLTIEIAGNGTVTETIFEESENSTNDNASPKKIILKAEPGDGWFFDQWEGDLTGNSNPDTVTVDDEKKVTAIFKEEFAENEYSLSVVTEGQGFISKDPEKATYTAGEEVALTAVPENGWSFKQWGGDLSGSDNPATIKMDGDKSVTAVFEEEPVSEYTIAINTEGEGSVDKQPDKDSYEEGEKVTLNAVPENGWSFKQWNGDLSGSDNPVTIKMDGNKSVTAVFEEEPFISLSVGVVKFFVDEMKLSGFRRTKDFITGDFILNLPAGGESFKITHTDVPDGFYDELELEISEPDDDIDIGDPDFVNENRKNSLVVKGSYNNIDFIFRSDIDLEIETDLSPPLRISDADNSIISLFSNFENWFKDSDYTVLDPNDPENKDTINRNIENSFNNF